LFLSDRSTNVVNLEHGERTAMATAGLRKFKFERRVGRTVVNPLVAALDRRGIRSALVVELETTGRKSGQPRRVPLTGSADADGVWVISQHGHRAGWAHNIEADPRVRVRVNGQWRSGAAAFQPDDDIRARARSFAKGKVSATATAIAMRAMESDPVSVRITFTD
jgi:deazaflavin-dependent oxidoreductase (nitroreductase family)